MLHFGPKVSWSIPQYDFANLWLGQPWRRTQIPEPHDLAAHFLSHSTHWSLFIQNNHIRVVGTNDASQFWQTNDPRHWRRVTALCLISGENVLQMAHLIKMQSGPILGDLVGLRRFWVNPETSYPSYFLWSYSSYSLLTRLEFPGLRVLAQILLKSAVGSAFEVPCSCHVPLLPQRTNFNVNPAHQLWGKASFWGTPPTSQRRFQLVSRYKATNQKAGLWVR